ncbi:MAG: inositol-3-phosphate synthase [Planctomycetaceae bacterium]
MSGERIGIWLIGAWGGVATTVATGLAALQRGAVKPVALVSSLPRFEKLGLAGWDQFVIGGHEIRKTSYGVEAAHLAGNSHLFGRELLEQVQPTLESFDRNVRTGTLINVGATIESLAAPATLKTRGEKPAAALARLTADLQEFQTREKLKHVVVVNVSSTEPPVPEGLEKMSLAELTKAVDSAENSIVPASTIYAIAAMRLGFSYVNFTPSVGSDIPAMKQLAQEKGTLHVGRDGKTGETLLKSILAPMFAARNLHVMSWVGHNIFGNMDGKVLDDPINKANKVRSKDHLLTEILGYKPQTLVSIEYIESMGDWKTAWDHIHFQGFLGTPMTMQFTWQGCDSILAAPLVLDLVRFTEREWRRGKKGVMAHLGSFFKSPMEAAHPEFQKQFTELEEWADAVAAEKSR